MNDASLPIPESLTGNLRYFDCRARYEDRHIIRGRPLTPYAVRYLDRKLAGQAREARLQDLEDINAPLAYTWKLRQAGWNAKKIAEHIGISLRAVYSRLARADEFMKGTLAPANDDERIRALELRNPRAMQVYVMMSFGWHQVRIAEVLECSVRTVQSDAAAAREAIGAIHPRALQRYIRSLGPLKETVVTTAEREELVRLNHPRPNMQNPALDTVR